MLFRIISFSLWLEFSHKCHLPSFELHNHALHLDWLLVQLDGWVDWLSVQLGYQSIPSPHQPTQSWWGWCTESQSTLHFAFRPSGCEDLNFKNQKIKRSTLPVCGKYEINNHFDCLLLALRSKDKILGKDSYSYTAQNLEMTLLKEFKMIFWFNFHKMRYAHYR